MEMFNKVNAKDMDYVLFYHNVKVNEASQSESTI